MDKHNSESVTRTTISYSNYKTLYTSIKALRDGLFDDFKKENLVQIRVLEAMLEGLDCALSTEDYRRLMDENFWRSPVRL